MEHFYKRFVRDRLHYHDEIFCAAGRVLRLIHEDAARLSGRSLPTSQHDQVGQYLYSTFAFAVINCLILLISIYRRRLVETFTKGLLSLHTTSVVGTSSIKTLGSVQRRSGIKPSICY